MGKVLVAFGSRYGSTQQIAEKISDFLKDQGLETQLLNLKEIKQKNWPALNNFDGILIGSGIKIGMWTKESKAFIKFAKSSNINNPLGAFVSCGEAMNPNNRSSARDRYLAKVLAKFGIQASLYDAFGGVFDLSETSNLGKINKKILVTVSKEDPTIKPNQRNDGRDWEQIKQFAMEFSKLVKK